MSLHGFAREGDIKALDEFFLTTREPQSKAAVNHLDKLHRANVMMTAADGFTALHFCAQAGCSEGCKELLDAGAEVDAKLHKTKKTPLHLAAAKGHAETASLLLSWGADVLARTNRGETPSDVSNGEAAITAALGEALGRYRLAETGKGLSSGAGAGAGAGVGAGTSAQAGRAEDRNTKPFHGGVRNEQSKEEGAFPAAPKGSGDPLGAGGDQNTGTGGACGGVRMGTPQAATGSMERLGGVGGATQGGVVAGLGYGEGAGEKRASAAAADEASEDSVVSSGLKQLAGGRVSGAKRKARKRQRAQASAGVTLLHLEEGEE